MDPYKILGISYDATEEEIKKAYRALSRKYHPDANVGKPNQKELEEKFKEVQQAYSMIMDQRQGKGQAQQAYHGAGSGGYGGNAWNPFGSEFWGFGGQGDPSGGSGYQQQEESKDAQYMRAALNYIQSGYFREGLHAEDSGIITVPLLITASATTQSRWSMPRQPASLNRTIRIMPVFYNAYRAAKRVISSAAPATAAIRPCRAPITAGSSARACSA